MDGLEFCRRLRATRPGQLVPFIFLTAKKDLEDRIQGHYIGADDYITKPFEPLELLAKIEAQLERSRRIHSEMVRLMQKVPEDHDSGSDYGDNQDLTTQAKDPEPEEDLPLTPAEARVFWEVIQGLTNKQISQRLFISPRTVQTHLSNILTKLNLENRSQLVRFAFEHGYRPPQTQEEQRAAEARGWCLCLHTHFLAEIGVGSVGRVASVGRKRICRLGWRMKPNTSNKASFIP